MNKSASSVIPNLTLENKSEIARNGFIGEALILRGHCEASHTTIHAPRNGYHIAPMRNPMHKTLQTVLVLGLFSAVSLFSGCKATSKEAATPAATAEPTAAVATAPVAPAKAVAATKPDAPIAPAKPVAPVAPAPIAPVAPAPVAPVAPAKPVTSIVPAQPVAPAAAPATTTAMPMSDMMYVVMKTNKGDVVMELDHKMAPKSVENFMAYVNANYYDKTIFHRVIRDFMIQGGGFTSDMAQKSTNAPIVNEGKNGLLNTRGTLAMARTNDPNSATSQFFINTVDNQFLNAGGRNPGYAVFGQVIDGMDVVDVIRAMPTKRGDVPVETVEIIYIRPLPGPPAAKK